MLRSKADAPWEYYNPHFLLAITEQIEAYYKVEDDVVDDWRVQHPPRPSGQGRADRKRTRDGPTPVAAGLTVEAGRIAAMRAVPR